MELMIGTSSYVINANVLLVLTIISVIVFLYMVYKQIKDVVQRRYQ